MFFQNTFNYNFLKHLQNTVRNVRKNALCCQSKFNVIFLIIFLIIVSNAQIQMRYGLRKL